MKKVMILGMAMIAFLGTNAQVDLGVKGGLNFSNFRGSDAEGTKSKAGVFSGLTASVSLPGNFYLQPELVYSQQGVKNTDEGVTAKVTSTYLNIPIMLAYRLKSGLYAETGPQFGYLLSSFMKAADEKISVKDQVKKADLSWGLGIGYMSKFNVGVNARYNLGLSKLDKQGESKVYNGVFQFGLVYFLKSL